MFRSIKPEAKLILAISVLSIIIIIVGVVGYTGINNIKTASDAIAKIRLPSIQHLQIINEAQTAMMIGERGLINGRMMDREIRSAQYEYIENAKKRSVESWKIYELLPQTEEEGKLWKEFIPEWEKWMEDNEKVIELSRKKDRLYDGGMKLDNSQIVQIDLQAFDASLQARQSFFRAKNILVRIIEVNIKTIEEESVFVDTIFINSKSILLVALIMGIAMSGMIGFLVIKIPGNNKI